MANDEKIWIGTGFSSAWAAMASILPRAPSMAAADSRKPKSVGISAFMVSEKRLTHSASGFGVRASSHHSRVAWISSSRSATSSVSLLPSMPRKGRVMGSPDKPAPLGSAVPRMRRLSRSAKVHACCSAGSPILARCFPLLPQKNGARESHFEILAVSSASQPKRFLIASDSQSSSSSGAVHLPIGSESSRSASSPAGDCLAPLIPTVTVLMPASLSNAGTMAP